MPRHLRPEELEHVSISVGAVPADFDCGNADLNDFLVNDAEKYHDACVAITFLVFHNCEVVGYYSVGMDCIKLKSRESKPIRKAHGLTHRFPEYPAIKIYRLGVREDYKHRRVGRNTVMSVVGYAKSQLQPHLGVRFVSVDALQTSTEFYSDLSFKENRHRDEKSLKDIAEKALREKVLFKLRIKSLVPRDATISMRLDIGA